MVVQFICHTFEKAALPDFDSGETPTVLRRRIVNLSCSENARSLFDPIGVIAIS